MFGLGNLFGGGLGGILPLYGLLFMINLVIKLLTGQLAPPATTP